MADTSQSSSQQQSSKGVSLVNMQAVLKSYEETRTNDSGNFDPVSLLEQMCEILETEFDRFLGSDPDPFEDRHPCRVDPSGQFGIILKAFFKKDCIIDDVLNRLEWNTCARGVRWGTLPLQ